MAISKESFFGHEDGEVEVILDRLKGVDQQMVAELTDCIDTMNRLQYLTKSMKLELFREVDRIKIAQSFRLAEKKLIKQVFEGVSTSVKTEILWHMQKQIPAGMVLDSMKELVSYIRRKEGSGEFVLTSCNKTV